MIKMFLFYYFMRIDLIKFINLIRELLDNKIDVDTYVGRYFQLFRDETSEITEEEYDILNTLFCDADDSEDDPQLFPESYITEQELRRRAKIALKNLNEMAEDEQKYKEKVALRKKELIDILIKWNLLNSVPDNEREEKYNEFIKLILMLFYDNDSKQKMIKCIRERLQKYLPNKLVPSDSDIDKFVDELLIWKEKSEDQTSKQ